MFNKILIAVLAIIVLGSIVAIACGDGDEAESCFDKEFGELEEKFPELFTFPLPNLTVVGISNGQVRLEFQRAGGEYASFVVEEDELDLHLIYQRNGVVDLPPIVGIVGQSTGFGCSDDWSNVVIGVDHEYYCANAGEDWALEVKKIIDEGAPSWYKPLRCDK